MTIILDTETTGKNAPIRPVEIAWLEVSPLLLHAAHFEQRFNPGKAIEYGAMATHGITRGDVLDCDPYDTFRTPEPITHLIGHNVDYDWEVIGRPECKRICTLALARKAWPDLDSHQLFACLWYARPDVAERFRGQAHGAKIDVKATYYVLKALCVKIGVESGDGFFERLYEASEAARVPVVMPFGEYKGKSIGDVPAKRRAYYLAWPDLDPYLRKALERV
jgi:exodeoxyribonuclease X